MNIKYPLAVGELCEIIKACSALGVQKLRIYKSGAIALRFYPQNQAETVLAIKTPEFPTLPPAEVARTEARVLAADELALKEAAEAMALIEDPELYEAMRMTDAPDDLPAKEGADGENAG